MLQDQSQAGLVQCNSKFYQENDTSSFSRDLKGNLKGVLAIRNKILKKNLRKKMQGCGIEAELQVLCNFHLEFIFPKLLEDSVWAGHLCPSSHSGVMAAQEEQCLSSAACDQNNN